MSRLVTKEGRHLTWVDPLAGEGWTKGKLGGVEVNVYVRPKAHGGGVFIRREESGKLHDAKTGEETVWFDNRLWTETEEREEIDRIRREVDENQG